jgi:hypothetical protein
MAYIDFATEAADRTVSAPAPAVTPRHDPVPLPATELSALEWSVVAVAYGDGLPSLRTPGRLAIALGNLFGSSHNPRLADPKLEALRRVAVLAWRYGYVIPASEVRAFLAAGYTADQYETLLASIGTARSKRKPPR